MNKTSEKLYDYIFSKLEIKDHERILEIGCGNGKFFQKYFIINQNIEVFGIDVSRTMIKQSIRNNKELIKEKKLSVIKSDIENLNFQNNFFNKIVTINTIYFWKNTINAASEMYRVLQSGDGILYIILRTKETLQQIPCAKYNFNYYEYQEIKSFLKFVGFRTISFDMIDSDIKTHKSICVWAKK